MGRIRININIKEGIGRGTSPDTDISIEKVERKTSSTKRSAAIARTGLRVATFALSISKAETPEDKLALFQLASFNLATNKLVQNTIDTRTSRISQKIDFEETRVTTSRQQAEVSTARILQQQSLTNQASVRDLIRAGAAKEVLAATQVVARANDDVIRLNKTRKAAAFTGALIGASAEVGVDLATAAVSSGIRNKQLQSSIGRNIRNTQFNRSLKGISVTNEF